MPDSIARRFCGVIVCALPLLFVACGGSGEPAPSPALGVIRPPATFVVSGGVASGEPAIEVVGVVPAAGSTVWDGRAVIVDYRRVDVAPGRPAAGNVVVERCRLLVDGRSRPALATFTPMSPAAFAVVFRPDSAVPPGPHTIRARLLLAGGGVLVCTWPASSR